MYSLFAGYWPGVDEQRHSQVTHMARAISANDLLSQVASPYPPTPIPSVSWLSLLFWPKSAHANSKVHYTGWFHVKYTFDSLERSIKMHTM